MRRLPAIQAKPQERFTDSESSRRVAAATPRRQQTAVGQPRSSSDPRPGCGLLPAASSECRIFTRSCSTSTRTGGWIALTTARTREFRVTAVTSGGCALGRTRATGVGPRAPAWRGAGRPRARPHRGAGRRRGPASGAIWPSWEVWRDLSSLAVLPHGDRVVMRSSYCPDGCELDRHSAGDSRFLSVDGDDGVLFEGTGPGAITRLWMTQGDDGISRPLDPEIWIRIVVDGNVAVQLPLPDFFAGDMPPFSPPLAMDLLSSGGNVSYVPIPYRECCQISLIGADHAKLWFQITAHELDSAHRSCRSRARKICPAGGSSRPSVPVTIRGRAVLSPPRAGSSSCVAERGW